MTCLWWKAPSPRPKTPSASNRCAGLSKLVVTIGACATAGGIQALRNFTNVKEYIPVVYAHPEYIKTLELSTPIAENIKVDFELRGCPINKNQLLEAIKALLQGQDAPVRRRERLCGLQDPGQYLRDGGRRHPLPGAGDPRRLRRPLPDLSPGLLRLLRAQRSPQHRVFEPPNCSSWGCPRPTSSASCGPSTPMPNLFGRRA